MPPADPPPPLRAAILDFRDPLKCLAPALP